MNNLDGNIEEKSSTVSREMEQQFRESDFDGHTDFQKMTFTQKLEWLSQVVVSAYLLAKDNPGAGCSSFFKSTSGEKSTA
jgi:hypothetical protein